MTSGTTSRVCVDAFHWPTVLPSAQALGAFRLALYPPNLLLALTMVVVVWLAGQTMDLAYGLRAYPNEISQHAALSPRAYDRWLVLARSEQRPSVGVFASALQFKVDRLKRLAVAAARGRWGFGPASAQQNTVKASLRDLFVTLPGWLWARHRWISFAYGVVALLIWAVLGGAMARTAALKATRRQPVGLGQSIRYAAAQWVQFFLTPLLPLLLAGLIALVPAIHGAIFFNFNVSVLEIIGGLTLIVPLVCCAVIAALLVLSIVAGPLLYPALAVEGTDCFDAMSRAFGYVLGRPWRWLTYNVMMWIYGVITYLLVGLFICLTLTITRYCVGLGVFRPAATGLDRVFAERAAGGGFGATFGTTAHVASLWVNLAVGLLIAYAISFYFSANTWIYLLLRQSADGTELDDIFVGNEGQPLQ